MLENSNVMSEDKSYRITLRLYPEKSEEDRKVYEYITKTRFRKNEYLKRCILMAEGDEMIRMSNRNHQGQVEINDGQINGFDSEFYNNLVKIVIDTIDKRERQKMSENGIDRIDGDEPINDENGDLDLGNSGESIDDDLNIDINLDDEDDLPEGAMDFMKNLGIMD